MEEDSRRQIRMCCHCEGGTGYTVRTVSRRRSPSVAKKNKNRVSSTKYRNVFRNAILMAFCSSLNVNLLKEILVVTSVGRKWDGHNSGSGCTFIVLIVGN
jgi:hypothetical protein